MYYSVINIKGPMVLLMDPDGDLQVFTKEFFDYEVEENDLVYLQNQMFHKAVEATEKAKEENYNRLQDLLD